MIGEVTLETVRQRRYEAVFGEVYEPLQRYVRRRTDAGSVDDVVADALLVVWRRLDDVPADAVLPWCYGVARRCLANHERSTRRAGRLAVRLAAEPPAPASNGGVDDGRGSGDADGELLAGLATLPEPDRELLRLWAWEQLAPREIAIVLDISANAVSIRLHRAKAKLADALRRKPLDRAGHQQDKHTNTDTTEVTG